MVRIEGKKGYVVFDIETTGLDPWYGDRVTCICAKDNCGGWYKNTGSSEEDVMAGFFGWLLDRPKESYLLVSKNGKRFDVPFLLSRSALIGGDCLNEVGRAVLAYEHFDLQYLTKKWMSLDDLARLFGCTPKSGTGLDAIRLWNEGRLEELVAYCAQDVETTEEVFLKWRAVSVKQ